MRRILRSFGLFMFVFPFTISSVNAVELLPVVDGHVSDVGPEVGSPRDGIPDFVEGDLGVSTTLNSLIESQGVIEFDLGFIALENIQRASLRVVPIGLERPAGTSSVPVQLYGFSGDGSLQLDDFNAGSFIAGFDVPADPFVSDPILLEVTEFLQNQHGFVGFNLRPNLLRTGVDFGSLELVSPATLVVELGPKFVEIDIKPGSEKNRVKPRNKGNAKVSVAILTQGEFDALQVDPETVRFGPDGAVAIRHKVKDVDHDGDADLLLRFKIRETGIACGDTEVTLTATTFAGQEVSGTDFIKTKGCKHRDDHSDSDGDSDKNRD